MQGTMPFDRKAFTLTARLAKQIGRPICILDLETTGFPNPAAPPGIVEIGYAIVNADGEVKVGGSLIHPGMPIPWQATKVHGIHDRDVISAHGFDQIAPFVTRLFDECVIVGFNSREFDGRVLAQNLARYGVKHGGARWELDVRDVWRAQQRTDFGKLAAVAAHYNVDAGEAHRAVGDVITTARILDAMLFRHGADVVIASMTDAQVPAPKRAATAAASERPQARPERPASDTSEQPKATDAKEPWSDPRRSSIRTCVIEHVAANHRILASDYQAIAARCGVKVSSVSFQVSDMLETCALQPEQVSDPSAQAVIGRHLAAAIVMAGGASRLKPLKEALDSISGVDTDYVQLRVAMRRSDSAPAARAASQPGMR